MTRAPPKPVGRTRARAVFGETASAGIAIGEFETLFWQNDSAKCGNFVRGKNPLAWHGIS